MADIERQLQDALKQVAKGEQMDFLQLGTVTEVDADALTCVVKDAHDIELYDVALQASEVADGVYMLPTVGSAVVVGHIGQNVYKVLMMSSVDQVNYTKGDITIVVNEEGIVINGGELGGLINIADLVEKLNTVEEDLNTIKQAFTTWAPAPMDGGAALKAATASWSGTTLTPTEVGDIEDDKITH